MILPLILLGRSRSAWLRSGVIQPSTDCRKRALYPQTTSFMHFQKCLICLRMPRLQPDLFERVLYTHVFSRPTSPLPVPLRAKRPSADLMFVQKMYVRWAVRAPEPGTDACESFLSRCLPV